MDTKDTGAKVLNLVGAIQTCVSCGFLESLNKNTYLAILELRILI